jgi:hypothetical protein
MSAKTTGPAGTNGPRPIRREGVSMKTVIGVSIVLLVVLVGVVATAATSAHVSVWNTVQPSIALMESQDVIGLPGQGAIDDLRAGVLTRIRFTTTAAVFVDSCQSLSNCAAAIQSVCQTMGDAPYQAKIDGDALCTGGCGDATTRDRTRRVRVVCLD